MRCFAHKSSYASHGARFPTRVEHRSLSYISPLISWDGWIRFTIAHIPVSRENTKVKLIAKSVHHVGNRADRSAGHIARQVITRKCKDRLLQQTVLFSVEELTASIACPWRFGATGPKRRRTSAQL